jgi:hypothetical protein
MNSRFLMRSLYAPRLRLQLQTASNEQAPACDRRLFMPQTCQQRSGKGGYPRQASDDRPGTVRVEAECVSRALRSA